ncbi:TetR/AcrR family transcriptional regulator [Photobacterium sp. WH77]|uniref:TetR/AcrR family transcriptional regulator n=1 Tax=Photobacterium arenosum TaxID=2774143 RepID=A0ABR9BH92_9GAMM|nr:MULTISPECIES: TetR/AcrR family transcriptional regulator [Photobacterium]MBD8511915.1 TetR/AcrR family transcriptional regulator [Photobacterium arenosum]MBV7261381.1 TetR/AcrR family transcriptional regulator [Photobacterium sp. WH24]MCG2836995.1 TetR/AcrR family transcriptional regulator [Photobacterium sp. WH77]MCG2844396.1 TetR/AcrR family transcriptional regulator [Photobacterium sp. WH80]MDO6581011.1 TetR/AcrR family transcriptional regulator [Photobacterium sp. 2_MG-2023]
MRSAEFDRETVLHSAMDAFIAKGYSKTSMQDLKQATGLHPGSIYCAFTNKRGLLVAALEHYQAERDKVFVQLFDSQPTIMAGIAAYLEQMVIECEQEEIKDCLLQKALSELARDDKEIERLISHKLKDWEQLFVCKFELAQRNGELSNQRNAKTLARYLVMGIYGIRAYSHTCPAPGVLRELSEELLRNIQGR